MTVDVNPHIAVFNCDRVDRDLADKYGDLGDLCCQLVANTGTSKYPTIKYNVLVELGDETQELGVLNLLYLDIIEKLEKNIIKGIILSGSASDSFDTSKLWINKLDEFLRNAVFQLTDFPLVGICFGHQIICKNLGCKVDRSPSEIGWECGLSTISLNPEIFSIENGKYMNLLKDQDGAINEHLNLPEIHRDTVYNIPSTSFKGSHFISIGSSAKCSIQGIVTASGPIKVLTFQGHPEFTTEFVLDLLESMHNKGTIDTPIYEKATYNSKILNNQGPLISKLICEFINSLT